MAQKYTGPERREYCEQHCQLSELSKKAVPWRVYIASISSLLMIAISYIGINEARLRTISSDYEKSIGNLTVTLDKRMVDQQMRYAEDVRRFYAVAQNNGALLRNLGEQIISVKMNQADIKAKQELVLKKIKMAE